jgi:hypothetical protein
MNERDLQRKLIAEALGWTHVNYGYFADKQALVGLPNPLSYIIPVPDFFTDKKWNRLALEKFVELLKEKR